ncbi:hypothetical protein Pla108_41600 [Botrimarina colliarenosi]|uniref:PEP-CTERM protein-sorting domain-containing protein n=1 Tax=Botrimarina colliarenosi TaxID=2528001 RepID=A0A5C5ZYI1_9BACT|nr:hypothetical protein [Botrimarina colliarenosi]TWT92017.1 hypothetical protein Pla108_41600 [Botrimarina colliarenosi]
MNATRIGRRLVAAAIALSLAPSVQAAILVDDFEGYAVGDVDAVASPPWTIETPATSQIATDGGNQYIVNAGSADWLHSYRSLGVSVSGVATLSFRIYVEDDAQIDHAFGLTDSSETIDWYGDYGPYVRVTTDAANVPGVASLDVRDGGGFVDDIFALNTQQWYEIALEIDTAGGDAGNGGFDVYVDGSLTYSSADFRRAFGAPLENFLLMSGQNTLGLVRVDDIRLEIVPEPLTATSVLGMVVLLAASRQRGR